MPLRLPQFVHRQANVRGCNIVYFMATFFLMNPSHPLTEYRARERLTKAALAKMLGVSKATMTKWESGTRSINVKRLPSIVAKTGIPAVDLRPDLKVKLGIA